MLFFLCNQSSNLTVLFLEYFLFFPKKIMRLLNFLKFFSARSKTIGKGLNALVIIKSVSIFFSLNISFEKPHAFKSNFS